MASQSDISSIPTPAHCTADFCLIPIGTSSPSVSAQVAEVQRLIERSGLKYSMHSAGTTLGMSCLTILYYCYCYCSRYCYCYSVHVHVWLYLMRCMATEGPWDKVHQVIGQAHTILHQQGIVRIQSDIRSGSRLDPSSLSLSLCVCVCVRIPTC
ncbi:hypothetical protein MAP00_003329 [Monascus purpureus]|nr:hypothetical protein MAP00_003329 [Monascus purpureus]